ncbi:hypothetical protein J5N97_000539 [Dioscorea zingiberensis]|uniref:Pentatricopeptide repeat-containing protein n=1 Tax=Dioscorea zingiberensis TaxID=325984 RepID=A0A9D5BSF0_9LILI|nr:hypothetical protein J5N97_000539 [Dioscorea zingiberensis]
MRPRNWVERMREEGMFPDVITFNSRISALCSAGKILEASRIFRDMHMDQALGLPQPNVVTYNLMLQGFLQGRDVRGSRELVQIYGKGWSKKLLEARLVLKEMIDKGIEPNIYSYNIVINGLCKNGMLRDARIVMGLMARNNISPDTVTYSTLLHGYCNKGKVFGSQQCSARDDNKELLPKYSYLQHSAAQFMERGKNIRSRGTAAKDE